MHPIDHQYAGLAYCDIRHDFDKSNQVGLNHTRARNHEEFPNQVTENPNDPLCAVRMISYMLSKSDDDPDGMPCRLFGKVRTGKKFKKSGNWFLAGRNNVSNRNIGVKKIGDQIKELAKLCGFDNWWLCTNHGQRRALQNAMVEAGISIEARAAKMRHNSIHSQVSYFNAQGATKDMTDALIQRKMPPVSSLLPTTENFASTSFPSVQNFARAPAGDLKRAPLDIKPAFVPVNVPVEKEATADDREAELLKQLEAVRSEKKQRVVQAPILQNHPMPIQFQQFQQPIQQPIVQPQTYILQTGPNGEQVLVPQQQPAQQQWNGQNGGMLVQQYQQPMYQQQAGQGMGTYHGQSFGEGANQK